MKKILAIIGIMVGAATLQAQEYKLSKSTGVLNIKDVNDVVFEGTTGNEIIFQSRNAKHDNDERAKGLKAISASGIEDNTGFGLSVIDKGDVIEVRQLKKMDGPEVRIMVPKGVSIKLSHTTPHGDDVRFTNVEGEIEVSTVHNSVILENPTGPLTINTVHGDIEARLGATFKSPISLVSVHGAVDLGISVGTKADLKLTTVYGEIFADPDFKIQMESKNELVKYSNTLNGKINGGGQLVTLSSTHGSVYLRKK